MGMNAAFTYLDIGLPTDVLRQWLRGGFDAAIRLIDRHLEMTHLPAALRQSMTVRREMLVRMPMDYPYTRDEALKIVRADIPGFTDAEFDALRDAGRIGWLCMDGEIRYFRRFWDTLLKTELDIARRAGAPLPDPSLLDDCIREMKEHGHAARRIRIRATMRIHDEAFTPGMFVRAHLPIPAECGQQSDLQIESTCGGMLAPADAPQRTVCWEERMTYNHPFEVVYSYTHKAIYHDTLTLLVQGEQPSFDTCELRPHIAFTPFLRALAEELTEGVTNPLEQARSFYDYITKNMKYTFMPAYFGLDSIAENCARDMRGDCGVFALLFITLCRLKGIPARWQSGLSAKPGECGAHDWAQFYIAPYGWLYADPSYGVSATRDNNEERRRFYFGNLDPYRMVANRAFQAPFTVDKQFWRDDPYDNQTGEIETSERGLLSHEFDREQTVLECLRV